MSEQFEAGLRDLYTAAEMAHDTQPGLPIGAMVARTRRTRRTRAAAVTLATAAAVVGVAVAGTAVVTNLDGPSAPPADGPTTTAAATHEPVTGTETEIACGTRLGDVVGVPEDRAITLNMALDTPELTAGELTGWLGTSVEESTAITRTVPGAGIPEGYGFVVLRDGVVVGTTQATLQEASPEDGDLFARTHDARISPVACDGAGLAPGTYDLVAFLPVDVETDPDTFVRAVLVSDTVSFAVPEPAPLLPADAHYVPDGASAVPPTDPAAPLPDGDYLAHVSEIDAEAGTVTADIVVLYFGTAADAWVAANTPGAEINDDYVVDDPDGPTERTIPIGDVPVWDLCPTIDLVQRTGGVAEWATAPTEGGESLCSDTSTIPVSGLYWLDVRGGVIAQVVAQYTP